MSKPGLAEILSLWSLCLLFLTATPWTSCVFAQIAGGPEKQKIEALITRVALALEGGGETVTATADAPDGDGVASQVETLTLTPGTVYNGSVEVYNDLADEPVEQDITAEIEEEDDEHQFFYTVGGFGDNVRVDITDFDDNELPLGLSFQVTATDAASGSGTLNVVLSHYDDEPKNGVDRSDETDIDVTFPVEIAP